ncbi:ABC-type transport auxiliary lipoprotein family protein [Alteromonas sp. ASW11-19]|uniref:ABC-type transport auxiliary lipoprotein family protein n=1 Tax=Alteromonas salexigens TaxID=2982530 RepID=A0ABT2VPJ7_9ALTE|nr:ABC-type transport auxiliary lipoprotein family protein [Alteromonas salexigens]MCU7555241.1 ABC-type transport auxiliary lipoprotein family protein [Alteromonas salexigens]
MRRMRILGYITLLGLLGGCASQAPQLQYYVLHSPAEKPAVSAPPASAVTLDQLILPEYLKQRSLTMQTSSTTLHYSPTHVWAEPVQHGVVQTLTSALLERGVTVLPTGRHRGEVMPATLSIQIDDMIATWQGEVILKGHFWLDAADKQGARQGFDYRAALSDDGFSHSISQLRGLIAQLADDIAATATR